jgi:hypothetical protein
MTMQLPILIDAEVVNDHVNIDLKNYIIPGEVTQDIEITRTFRVLDVYTDTGLYYMKVKYFDNELTIQLTADDWAVVDGLWQTL